ncbi:MAG: MoaD/ThiS family protein [Bacteroidia bacterium]|nr:MoaD/ThiS family protein [Bacteroidia bacterium]
MQIQLFGVLKEKLETGTIILEFSGNLQGLKNLLQEKYPQLHHQRYSVAVNQKVVFNPEQFLSETDVVALLPPFSGG